MDSTGLFLREKQVVCGMRVALCLEGKNTPETDEEGNPLIFIALMGGIPKRKLFYDIKTGIVRHGSSILAHHIEGFKPNVRFMPVQVFSTKNAPVETEFVVFVNGERLQYPKRTPADIEYVYIITDDKGRFLSSHPYMHDFFEREHPLPDNVVLVPITEIGKSEKATRIRIERVYSALVKECGIIPH